VVTRRGADSDYVIAVNHRADAVSIPVSGTELFSGTDVADSFEVAGGAVAVFRTSGGGGGRPGA
jgi:beta-galactosidase